jgi:hypothetical protein
MDELGLPFDQVQIEGHLRHKVGEKDSAFGPVPVYGEPSEKADARLFFTLYVCKDCRADWMMAIKRWFEQRPARDDVGSGIFVRELGSVREVSVEEFQRRRR